jgi:peroxiredoxin
MERCRNWIVLFFFCFIAVCCSRESKEREGQSYVIHGTLKNQTSGYIVLRLAVNRSTVRRDSSRVQVDGHFEFRGTTPERQVAQLSVTDENALWLVLDSPDITVTADARDLAGTALITGSNESDLLLSLMAAIRGNRDAQGRVQRQFAMAQMADEPDSLLYFQEQFAALRAEAARQVKDFIRRHPDSFTATYAASTLLNRKGEDAFLDSMLLVFNKHIPNSAYVQELNEWARNRIRISLGSMAPDVTLPQQDGSRLSLSSLRGKWVLVDFWASWCGPCRKENPQVVALYNQYKDRGFDILGVSLDESKDQWLDAVRKDGLPWHQVCDLMGARGAAVHAYDVQTIPMTVLVDKDGKIVALNLRGITLAQKLKELMGD